MNDSLRAAKIAYDTAVQNAKTAEQAFEQCAAQVARDSADPSKTGSSASCDVKEAAKEIRDANYEAYKALLKLRMTQAGAKAEEVEEWVESHGKELWKKAEKLRKAQAVQKAEKSVAKGIAWTLAKAAMIFLAIGGFLHYKFGPEEPWHTTPATYDVKIIPVEPMIPTDQFNMMIGGLVMPVIHSAPEPVLPPELPHAAPAPAQPIPAAPAPAVEAEPATVEVVTPTGTQTIQTTVGQVYRAAPPQVRQQMEVPKIEHDYNKSITEDPNSCFVRHCLTPHKDFSVSADFDTGGKQTAHFHY